MNTPFNKVSCQIFRSEINAALEAIAKKHGVSIAAGAAKFTNQTIEFKLNIGAITSTGVVATKESLALPGAITAHGLAIVNGDLSFTTSQGLKLTLTGYNHRCYARPWIATDFAGRSYKVPTETVTRGFGTKRIVLTGITRL